MYNYFNVCAFCVLCCRLARLSTTHCRIITHRVEASSRIHDPLIVHAHANAVMNLLGANYKQAASYALLDTDNITPKDTVQITRKQLKCQSMCGCASAYAHARFKLQTPIRDANACVLHTAVISTAFSFRWEHRLMHKDY